ncbi:MAG: hypothetical protein R2940_06175 [Syntrophotaleaceae bacterium]
MRKEQFRRKTASLLPCGWRGDITGENRKRLSGSKREDSKATSRSARTGTSRPDLEEVVTACRSATSTTTLHSWEIWGLLWFVLRGWEKEREQQDDDASPSSIALPLSPFIAAQT